MSWDLTREQLARIAGECGLAVVGITDAAPFHELAGYLTDHVARGHLRGMDWYTTERALASCEPRTLHDDPRSIVSFAVPYWTGPAEPPDDGVLRGRIARYAWGRDYHGTLKRRMRALVVRLEDELGRTIDARTLVDTARIVDRAAAARAGTGWYGKNTMIIVPGHGSWVMLGELLSDLALPPDLPLARDCGRCTICLDRCPTGAIVAPYRVDAPRCISYLTIEHRGAIPHDLRPLMGGWVFGCDVCQEVCPYTGAARPVSDADFAPASIENQFPSLELLLTLDEAGFRARYSGTPVTRPKRAGIARNAAIALGNSGDPRAAPILARALRSHDSALVRGHAAMALRRLIGEDARGELDRARAVEPDDWVRGEIELALAG